MKWLRVNPPSSERGFTLIEVLVSLFIFSLISVGTMAALTQSFSGRAQINAATDQLHELNRMRAILRRDLERVSLIAVRDSLGGQAPYSLILGDGNKLLGFVRQGRENPGGLMTRGDLERVEYRFENNQFIRRSFPHVNSSQGANYIDRTLLANVREARFYGLKYRNGVYEKIYDLRLEHDDKTGLPEAIILDITDDHETSVQHYFEIG